MKQEYTAPYHGGEAFNCPQPHCNAYAQQHWTRPVAQVGTGTQVVDGLMAAYCARCGAYSLWLNEEMIHPAASIAPMPNDDMPDDVEEDYMEARTIVLLSPRGACALLRLAVQKLTPHLEQKGKDLDDDIGELVKRGLPAGIQKALDSLRVVGNNAVHPGVLDLKDDVPTATALFEALNMIVDAMITQPKAIEELYAKLPETSKEHIRERDSSEPSP